MGDDPALEAVFVILPSLNPTGVLNDTIAGLLDAGFSRIILVNDGSAPETLPFFEQAARRPEVTLLHHQVNRGKGAAMKTAFSWLLEHRPGCAGVVTVDGDGQHHPEDALACARRMLETQRVILGCRDFSLPEVPPRSRMGNRITCAVFRVFCGMRLSDTQTGLRAIPGKYLAALTAVSGERYEYETNMLLALKDQGIPYEENVIRTIYLEENRSSHFHVIRDSWKIYKLILARFFRYTLSSLLCAVVDAWLFALLSSVLQWRLWGMAHTAAAAGGARLVSSLLNFALNRSLVFRFTGRSMQALVRYYMLVIVQYLAQLGLTQGLYQLLHIHREYSTVRHTVIYVIVMMALFVASYVIQRRWVFAAEKKDAQKGNS